MNNKRSSSLFWIVLLGLILVPLQPLELPFFIETIIGLAVMVLTFIIQPVGIIANCGIWIWSLTKIIHQPFNLYHIIYYLFLALYAFIMIIPYIIGIIYAVINRSDKY